MVTFEPAFERGVREQVASGGVRQFHFFEHLEIDAAADVGRGRRPDALAEVEDQRSVPVRLVLHDEIVTELFQRGVGRAAADIAGRRCRFHFEFPRGIAGIIDVFHFLDAGGIGESGDLLFSGHVRDVALAVEGVFDAFRIGKRQEDPLHAAVPAEFEIFVRRLIEPDVQLQTVVRQDGEGLVGGLPDFRADLFLQLPDEFAAVAFERAGCRVEAAPEGLFVFQVIDGTGSRHLGDHDAVGGNFDDAVRRQFGFFVAEDDGIAVDHRRELTDCGGRRGGCFRGFAGGNRRQGRLNCQCCTQHCEDSKTLFHSGYLS